jgi:hypothetical protein
MVVWGSATHHKRTMVALPPRRGGHHFCPWCPKETNRVTHSGRANGVALMAGCEWHVRQWVKNPNALRRYS